uniref:Flavin-containing monooxygenase n=1 Tax=Macrostomum lignano TaxID=282301 RepID=A0A1I8FL89_9PLAT
MISSKQMSCFSDFPRVRQPSCTTRWVLLYLRLYAEQFQLTSRIIFGAKVLSVQPELPTDVNTRWIVEVNQRNVTADGRTEQLSVRRKFGAVLISATGHHWQANCPRPSGIANFTGDICHSSSYVDYQRFANKRVLVVGLGNSARRYRLRTYCRGGGSWIVGKTGPFGWPMDALATTRLGRLLLPDWALECAVRAFANFKHCHQHLGLRPEYRCVDRVLRNVKIVYTMVLLLDASNNSPPAALQYRIADGFVSVKPGLNTVVEHLFPRYWKPKPDGPPRCSLNVKLMTFTTSCLALKKRRRNPVERKRRIRVKLTGSTSMDMLADEIGCRPRLLSLLLQHRSLGLALRCWCQPCLPAQYRLVGRHGWPEGCALHQQRWLNGRWSSDEYLTATKPTQKLPLIPGKHNKKNSRGKQVELLPKVLLTENMKSEGRPTPARRRPLYSDRLDRFFETSLKAMAAAHDLKTIDEVTPASSAGSHGSSQLASAESGCSCQRSAVQPFDCHQTRRFLLTEGESLRLSCGVCGRLSAGPLIAGATTTKITVKHESGGRVLIFDMLVISRANLAALACTPVSFRGKMRARFVVTVVAGGVEPYREFEPGSGRSLQPKLLSKGNLEVYTRWMDQTSLDADRPVVPEGNPLLKLIPQAPAVRSHLLPVSVRSLRSVIKRPSETAQDSNSLSEFSFGLTETKYTTVSPASGEFVSLQCPLTRTLRTLIAWFTLPNDTERLRIETAEIVAGIMDPYSLRENSSGRVFTDPGGNLNIADTSGKYYCLHKGRVVGYVNLIIRHAKEESHIMYITSLVMNVLRVASP